MSTSTIGLLNLFSFSWQHVWFLANIPKEANRVAYV